MSVAATPAKAHMRLTDGTGLDVKLNGERMQYRDAYDDAVTVDAPYRDGVLVVCVAWDSGLTVEAAHLDDDENTAKAIIPCVLEVEEYDGDTKLFLADDERYAFEIELVRVYPDETEAEEVQNDV